ncbi:hypothetical protein KCH_64260 [Kitasatospora cheerisanensis KCTC 2395]|uniref:Uncharacterized protein n=1 Tax=Kitasatospora cheerisanensis KCTC 2395 TaxID=1348663 RepID=A0A066YUG4_9ACTN|nr:hypothetical protein KCH_64260 [Kitasatospora cheerisanensis KCTC 2395]
MTDLRRFPLTTGIGPVHCVHRPGAAGLRATPAPPGSHAFSPPPHWS